MAFTKSLTKEYDFDGAKITVSFKRMSRVSAKAIGPHMDTMSDGSIKVKFADGLDFIDKVAGILDECVTSISGLVIDGQEVKVGSDDWKNEVLGGTYFTDLLKMIFGDIMQASWVSGETEKKPQPQPEESLKV